MEEGCTAEQVWETPARGEGLTSQSREGQELGVRARFTWSSLALLLHFLVVVMLIAQLPPQINACFLHLAPAVFLRKMGGIFVKETVRLQDGSKTEGRHILPLHPQNLYCSRVNHSVKLSLAYKRCELPE